LLIISSLIFRRRSTWSSSFSRSKVFTAENPSSNAKEVSNFFGETQPQGRLNIKGNIFHIASTFSIAFTKSEKYCTLEKKYLTKIPSNKNIFEC
jgi:hypothetical protein